MISRVARFGMASVAGLLAVSAAAEARAAETPSLRAMTLGEALDYARAHQPDLRAAAARVESVKAQAAIARARWYPTVTATAQLLASTTNNSTGSYLTVPLLDNPRVSATRAESAATASLAPSPSTMVGAGVRQLVYDFGRIAAEAASDDLRADAASLSLASSRIVVDYDVEETYFAVHAAKSVLTASEQAYERAVVHRDLARAGVESGLRRPIELTRAEAALDRYELERIHAKRGVSVAQAVLAATVGVPDHLLDIAGPPPGPQELPSLDAAFARASDQNPELRAALTRVRAQEEASKAIARAASPSLFLTGAVSGNAGGAIPSSGESAAAHGLLPSVPNWDVGVVLAWPLFDATVSARTRQSRADENALREQAGALRFKIAAEVEEAYIDVQAARDALPVLQHAVKAGVANYEQADARFGVGLGNAVELADAEDVRTAAEIQLALGVFELARARALLGRVIAEGI